MRITGPVALTGSTGINVAAGTVQEAGVDISPIGLQDLSVSVTSMYVTTTLPATGPTVTELPTNDIDIQTMDFTSTAADERVQFRTVLPANYDGAAWQG